MRVVHSITLSINSPNLGHKGSSLRREAMTLRFLASFTRSSRSKPRDIISPVYPGSASGRSPRFTHLKNTSPGRHPGQLLNPPQCGGAAALPWTSPRCLSSSPSWLTPTHPPLIIYSAIWICDVVLTWPMAHDHRWRWQRFLYSSFKAFIFSVQYVKCRFETTLSYNTHGITITCILCIQYILYLLNLVMSSSTQKQILCGCITKCYIYKVLHSEVPCLRKQT